MTHAIAHPGLRAAFDYWHGKCRGRPMPSRADIDPTEIPALLPHVVLLDVEASPLRFRFRLVGSHIYDIRGGVHARRELTGQYLDETQFSMSDSGTVAALGHRIVNERRPLLCHGPAKLAHGRTGSQDFLVLPLSSDGSTVDMLMVVLFSSEVATDRPLAGVTL